MFSIDTVQGWLFYFKMKKEFYKEDEIVFQKKPSGSKFLNIEGVVFGRLTILGCAGKFGVAKKWKWYCRCKCGNIVSVFYGNLSTGASISCGCARRDIIKQARTTHGREGSLIYQVWSSMKARCSNPNNVYFDYYGGRGIKVCERWQKFENFLADMGERPMGASIDRIDNNGNYEPTNCRWATPKEQCSNKRSNVFITHDNETKTITQWCEEKGIGKSMLQYRISRGWQIGEALNTPSRFKRRNDLQS